MQTPAALPSPHLRASRLTGSDVAPAAAAAILALLVYGCTLHGTFVYDDRAVILSDPRISSPGLWGTFWTRPYMLMRADKLYRPLVSMSFAVQWFIHGSRAWPYHAVNLVLHACVAAGVAELGRRLAGVPVAWVAGLLFAVHPAHVEAVAGLVGRSELLCALATIAGLCAFLSRPLNPRRILFISLCFVVALLSKEQGMLFPGLLCALVPFRAKQVTEPPGSRAKLWLCVSLVYLLAAYVFVRERMIGFTWDKVFLEWVMNPMVRSHGIDRALIPVVLIGRYFVLLVAPRRQSLDYGGAAIGWTVNAQEPYLYVGALAVLGWVVVLVWSLRRRNWAVFFCLLGLAMTYGMVGNIVALIGTIFAERLMYLPSAFFLLVVAMGVARMPRAMALTLTIALTIAGSVLAFNYARLWNTPEALFRQCIKNQPGAERGYDLLFRQLSLRGDWTDAREVARAAEKAVPESDRPYAMLIDADVQLGDADDAWASYVRGMGRCRGFDRLFLLPYAEKATTRPATRPRK